MIGLIIILALYVMFLWPMYSRIVLDKEVTPSVNDFKKQISDSVQQAREDWKNK